MLLIKSRCCARNKGREQQKCLETLATTNCWRKSAGEVRVLFIAPIKRVSIGSVALKVIGLGPGPLKRI